MPSFKALNGFGRSPYGIKMVLQGDYKHFNSFTFKDVVKLTLHL